MHLIHQLNPGGAENGVVNIANGIDKKAFDISICTFQKEGLLVPRLHEDVTVFELAKRNGNDIRIPFEVYRVIRDWQPDIVHTHSWGTLLEGFLPSMVAGVPVRIHGEHGTIQAKPKQRIIQKLFFYLADQILSVSMEHKARLAKTIGFPESKIEVIDNGVDTAKFSPLQDTGKFQSNGLKTEVVIGTVGRMEPVKNQKLLIDAAYQLLNNHRKIKLMLVGDGSLMPELKNQVKSLGIENQVIFTGQQFNIEKMYKKMDVFVLPSLSEGMSNTVLEAMSSGLPVIGTDVGDNFRLINNGENGFIIDSGAVPQLTEKLDILIKDKAKRRAFGMKARQKMEHQFSISSMVHNYEKLYRTSIES